MYVSVFNRYFCLSSVCILDVLGNSARSYGILPFMVGLAGVAFNCTYQSVKWLFYFMTPAPGPLLSHFHIINLFLEETPEVMRLGIAVALPLIGL